ncbi:MAG: helix-turn-helix transcriptional regulator [Clostridium sp.]|nr:helix-turn-helix transcriptional regulator [Clostridium sp.]
MSIGKNIRTLRKCRKITMKQLGEMIGISEQGIGNYERDERTPSINVLIQIAAALNVSLEELISTPEATKEVIEQWDKDIDTFKLQEDAKVAEAIDLLLKEKGHNIEDFTEEEFEKIKNSLLEYLDTIAYMKK